MRILGSAVLAFLLCVAACRNRPSREFEEASESFKTLYGQYFDEAYVRPEMLEIETKLRSVPAGSRDAAAAEALLSRIRSERERVQKDRAARTEDLAEALRPTPPMEFSPTPTEIRPDAGRPPEVDAGVPQPIPGMPVEELQSRWGRCFTSGEDVEVSGVGMRPTLVLKNIANCRDRHPGFDNRLVILNGASVLSVVPLTSLERVVRDAGTPKTIDAGWEIDVALPPDAGLEKK